MINRSNAPVQFNFTSFQFPKPEQIVSEKGFKIHYFRIKGNNAIKTEFLLRNANSFNEDILGANLLTSKLFLSGTKKKNASSISENLAQLGAFVDISPSFDYTSVTIYCLKKNLIKTLSLFYEILNEIQFPEEEIILQKKILTSNYSIQQKKNNIKASQLLRKSLFNQYPYGLTPSPDNWENITADALKSTFNNNWLNIESIIIGDLDNILLTEVKNTFSLNNSNVKTEQIQFKKSVQSENLNVNVSGSIQTSLKLGKTIIGRNHEDYHKLLLTNYILGGFFGSKLMKNIREDKGLTYGIHSSIVNLKNASYFVISSDVDSSKKEVATKEIIKEIINLINSNLGNEELTLAKNHWLGSFQNEFSSALTLNDKFKNYYLSGLGDDYYSVLVENIRNISISEICKTANKYLQPSSLSIVQVGG